VPDDDGRRCKAVWGVRGAFLDQIAARVGCSLDILTRLTAAKRQAELSGDLAGLDPGLAHEWR